MISNFWRIKKIRQASKSNKYYMTKDISFKTKENIVWKDMSFFCVV